MFIRAAAEVNAEVKNLSSDKLTAIDPSGAHHDARLGAVISDISATFRDGSSGRCSAFTIVTKDWVISINAYSAPTNADIVFEQARAIVSTLEVKDDQKMPASWTERLKQLLGR